MESWLTDKCVLITGGTSGLGKSLANLFLMQGCKVITVSRSEGLTTQEKRYRHFTCDFADLGSIRSMYLKIANSESSIDILVNNAGILSPPEYHKSKNGFELSYQVNFLAHVFLNRKLIEDRLVKTDCIVNISSPIHTKGKLDLRYIVDGKYYKLLSAYANSKLYLALFSQHLNTAGYNCFSFDPGTFSSGIYRAQKKWFHRLYKVAAPFMISSDVVANGLMQIIKDQNWSNGRMMNRHGKIGKLLKCDPVMVEEFWRSVEKQLMEVEAEL